jgi:hypothetical protein
MGVLAGAPLMLASGGITWAAAGLFASVATLSYFSAHVWLLTHSERYQRSRLIQGIMAADARLVRNTA